MPSNTWQLFRYSLWAPHYDRVTKLQPQRRRSLELLALRPGERLLIIGCGTGADLPFVPEGVRVLATDLTPAMLRQARKRARPEHELRVMDGLALDLPEGSFDAKLSSCATTGAISPVTMVAAMTIAVIDARMPFMAQYPLGSDCLENEQQRNTAMYVPA